MRTIFLTLIILSCVILTNCKSKPNSTNQLGARDNSLDTNFLGMNYYEYNSLMGLKFYDTLPNVIKQIKSMKELTIKRYSNAIGGLPGYIFLNGKFANLETSEIYLNFDDNVFTFAIVDLGFSDSEAKYKALKEVFDKKYGTGNEFRKDEACTWDFSYYVGGVKHEGGRFSLAVDLIYLKINYNTEKEEYFRARQDKRTTPKINIDTKKL
jgi:hypothetical protein